MKHIRYVKGNSDRATISKSPRQYLSNITRKIEIKELQKHESKIGDLQNVIPVLC
jgi:hypothetical protein